ncbi:thiopurine S-methyltransferase [Parachitinimonas caeni]|uniref:Thiopurine S-methyltransferase n=1 Tax=Parachitinimonas caeni TaxID=3031301 RepID=A0ABT7E042_9NEIS|nr:thiopurine S-methyltransferase [Parachitinimonas caeni]MDK2125670.1 thiopurine S-methyltransferase [Parachitinimonas caeni]
MDANFWHRKWEANEIGFHISTANPLLVRHIGQLALATGSRLFLPLCGKTLDIGWLLAQGYQVAGAELSELAVQQLFAELGVVPVISQHGALKCYQTGNLQVWVGDIFAVSAEQLGRVDAVYDRAALVALPDPVRPRYTAHLREIIAQAPQLLVCYAYDQSVQPGPPFSINQAEVLHHYAEYYDISLLESVEVVGGMKGKCAAWEHVFHLAKR